MPGALVRGLVQAFLIEHGKASLSREWLSDISGFATGVSQYEA
jgi:hypothetical protein